MWGIFVSQLSLRGGTKIGCDFLGTRRKHCLGALCLCGSCSTQLSLDFSFLFHEFAPNNKENIIVLFFN